MPFTPSSDRSPPGLLTSPGVAAVTGAFTQATRPLDLSGRAVLLASDGSPGSMAAARVAHELALQHHAVVHLLSVVDTRSAPIPPPLDLALAAADSVAGPALHEAQCAETRAQVGAAIGAQVDWPVRTMLGVPAVAIAQEARRLGAVLILIGLRHHHPLSRAMGDDTALGVIRHAHCPVLGVVEGTTRLPSRVLAAVDFGETSLLAARTARALVGDHASMVLAYVPPLTLVPPEDGEHVIHDAGVQACFARTTAMLGEEGIHFDHVVLHHAQSRPTADILLEYADTARCDLVSAGSARHGRFERWMMGSVSTDLVRHGRHNVLVVPPRSPVRD